MKRETNNMKPCKYCNGTGEIEIYDERYPMGRKDKCKGCSGLGKVYNAIKQV